MRLVGAAGPSVATARPVTPSFATSEPKGSLDARPELIPTERPSAVRIGGLATPLMNEPKQAAGRLTSALVPVLCLGLLAAQAQTSEPHDLESLLDFLDRDGDGRIEPYEGAEAFLHLAWSANADDDPALTADELVLFLERVREEDLAERFEMFEELDADGDGRIDEDPYEDLNGDGEIGHMFVPDPKGKYRRLASRMVRAGPAYSPCPNTLNGAL